MNFIVTDRQSIEEGILVRSSYVIISIRDPDKKKARIPKQSALRDVLYLAFHDAEPSETHCLPETIVLMGEQQARQIWQFALKWKDRVGAVVVHCEAGMSRSPAVAAAVCCAYGEDHTCFFRTHQPNQYVFDLMMRCPHGPGFQSGRYLDDESEGRA